MTRFEDLSNEIFYEIFDYLDDIYVSKTFSDLNYRFYQLIHQCCLPVKVYLSYESVENFNNHIPNILAAFKHRLQSLRVSDCFFLEKFHFNSSLIRLQALYFEGIQYSSLVSTLLTCTQLPSLYYLTFNCVENVQCPDKVYSLIFSLPVLKFCQLSLNSMDEGYEFVFYDFAISPIERLIINSKCSVKNLMELVSFAPNLSHLSCEISNSLLFSDIPLVNENLTNLSLKFDGVSFDEVEWFIKNLSSPIQTFTISVIHDRAFLNSNRWQRILTQQLPLLRKFMLEYYDRRDDSLDDDVIKQFQSSFWTEKQCFFVQQYYIDKHSTNWRRLYSTKPYKWKTYQFNEKSCSTSESGVNLAYEVDLHHYQSIPYRFLRANRLILSQGNPLHLNEIFSHFSCRQLTELIMSDERLRLENLFSLITHLPNLKNLTIHPNNLILILPQTEIRRVVFPQNHISKITISNRSSIQEIQIVQRLCPFLQMLDVEVDTEQIESIIRILLLQRINRQNSLSTLCFRESQFLLAEKLKKSIKRDHCFIYYFDQKIFLWLF